MEKNKISSATLIDIIFDGRNKEYGAYELRKKYNSRLTSALGVTAGMAAVIFFSSYVLSSAPGSSVKPEIPANVQLTEVDMKKEEPVIIPQKKIEPVQTATIKNVTYRVVKDEDVKKEEIPPEVDQLEDAKISTVTNPGDKFEGVVAPPVEDRGGVVDAPKMDDEDKVFQKVEIDAEFPGGVAGWTKYVTREIERNIDELQNEARSGTVVVLFIVDKEGLVSEVRALPCGEAGVANCLGPGTKLSEIAVNAVRKGPKWKAAVQNGRPVKAYRRQPVTFQLAEE